MYVFLLLLFCTVVFENLKVKISKQDKNRVSNANFEAFVWKDLKEIWSVLHVAKKIAHNTADAGSGRQNMNSKTHCWKPTGETKTSRAEEKQIAEEHAP